MHTRWTRSWSKNPPAKSPAAFSIDNKWQRYNPDMDALLELPPLERTMVLDPPLTDEELEQLCFSDTIFQFERTKEGEIVMHSPAAGYTGDGNREIIYQLSAWWRQHRIGRAFDSNTGFFLPDNSMLSPDAAYVAPERLRGITREDGKHFLRVCPNFVIELLSASDRLKKTQRKIADWIANGAELAWLVDPYRKQVYIYEPAKAVRIGEGLSLAGSGPAEGFTLDLAEVWSRYEPDVE
jgi:Uma2 family endonuclease